MKPLPSAELGNKDRVTHAVDELIATLKESNPVSLLCLAKDPHGEYRLLSENVTDEDMQLIGRIFACRPQMSPKSILKRASKIAGNMEDKIGREVANGVLDSAVFMLLDATGQHHSGFQFAGDCRILKELVRDLDEAIDDIEAQEG